MADSIVNFDTVECGDPSGRYSHLAGEYQKSGVVLLRKALEEQHMLLLDEIFDYYIDLFRKTRATGYEALYPKEKSRIEFATANSVDLPLYRKFLQDSPLADVANDLFEMRGVWYWADQLWYKDGGARRTPWHQDSSYIPFQGLGLVNFWIPLHDLPQESVLEVVRGSHVGPLYNAMTYNPDDDTDPLYDTNLMPRLPDIQADRSAWDIHSASMKRGDVLAFHPACLHGGGATNEGEPRRAISFRMFSDDVTFVPLPTVEVGADRTEHQRKWDEHDTDVANRGFAELAPGDPLTMSSAFRRIRPWHG